MGQKLWCQQLLEQKNGGGYFTFFLSSAWAATAPTSLAAMDVNNGAEAEQVAPEIFLPPKGPVSCPPKIVFIEYADWMKVDSSGAKPMYSF